jgi:hypothetical protein
METKKTMTVSKDKLTAKWIQYLKNNQIIGMKSDPATGDLDYKREITTTDITKFLLNRTEYSEEQVNNAIKMVMAKGASKNQAGRLQNNPTPKEPGRELSTWQQTNMQPGDLRHTDIKSLPPAASRETPPSKSKYSKDDAEDVNFREIKEAIKDTTGQQFSEADVEAVFTMLSSVEPESSVKSTGKEKSRQGQQPAEKTPEDPARKQEDIKKMMRIIRDTMSPSQRKMLWRALQDGREQVAESQINTPDVKAVLKGVSDLRANPSILGKLPGLRKDKINISDLQKAWADGDTENGIPQYSDDTRDIKYILSRKFGYSSAEIDKVFAQVFGRGSGGQPEEPAQSAAIQRFAEYSKKNGIDNEIIAFMQREFSKELGLDAGNDTKSSSISHRVGNKIGSLFKRKAVAEEVRDIFTAIVNEERSDQPILARQFQQTHLGRIKK